MTNVEKYEALVAEIAKVKDTAKEADEIVGVAVSWGKLLERMTEIIDS